jgi:hypothetical protein
MAPLAGLELFSIFSWGDARNALAPGYIRSPRWGSRAPSVFVFMLSPVSLRELYAIQSARSISSRLIEFRFINFDVEFYLGEFDCD